MKILLTGGAGYIGSHTAVEFLLAGHEIVVVDNLSNSSATAISRVERLTNGHIGFYQEDVLDGAALNNIFETESIDAVIHFAGLKAVGESVVQPLDYYHTNINGTLNLCRLMLKHQVSRLVFSSSATVYGEPKKMPIDESTPVTDAANPYGRTKLMIERILEDIVNSEPDFHVARLRYFNPGGAHQSGEIGEDPSGIPNNLLPYITQVAIGKREKLVVNGDDYPTKDGTCIRDYIHVVDLARGHLAALDKLMASPGLVTYNLGTGTGYSVMDIVRAFEKANDITLPLSIGPRRAGDIPTSYTDPNLALKELNWKAEKTIEDICRDAWHWQQKNPNGYG
ncbi:MAG: UDP-glucose 4-epimerase GalE [bacterium]|nr:UDP-glucose 4-epimerase GalE [Gammaproteobacteria bacterium]HIL96764.1 UDP-glucose 4-epimerase GalE [Pseudomonadales bacterium]